MQEIGIKLADGTFYPILSDTVRFQNIELTTVRDNQETVQIDLFRNGDSLEYIGSLIVEDIAQKKAGESTIALKLQIDENENLKAEASDLDSGAGQALKVSLASVTPEKDFNDFNLSDFELPPQKDFSTVASENFIDTTKNEETELPGADEKKRSKWFFILLILLGAGLLVMAVLLLTRSCSNQKEKPAENKTELTVPTPETTSKIPEPATDTLDITASSTGTASNDAGLNKATANTETAEDAATEQTADTSAVTEAAKTSSDDTAANSTVTTAKTTETTVSETTNTSDTAETKTDTITTGTTAGTGAADTAMSGTDNVRLQTNADGSVRYLIKWGDTLWDLAETFYKNPWDYTIIAQYNNIKNPSYIIAGTYITIPVK